MKKKIIKYNRKKILKDYKLKINQPKKMYIFVYNILMYIR